jgi:rhodanese-related sulfurtransferase
MGVRNLTNSELKQWMTQHPDLLLLDVRTSQEFFMLGHIPGARLLPIHELPGNLESMDPARKTVVICEHGIRSHDASHFLHHHGFADIGHLTAGMAEWDGAREFDNPLKGARHERVEQ